MRIRVLSWFLCGVLLTGCAGTGASTASIRKGSPVVYIHPLTDNYAQARIGVLPFQVPAGTEVEQGMRVAALFKDVLLGRRVFPVVLQLADPYGNFDEALALGRRAGVDLVLAGRVGSALSGTELGGARVSVALRLLDTQSGQTVWYVEQAAEEPLQSPDFSLKSRLLSSFSPPPIRPVAGAPSATTMLAQIATDFAAVLQGARSVPR